MDNPLVNFCSFCGTYVPVKAVVATLCPLCEQAIDVGPLLQSERTYNLVQADDQREESVDKRAERPVINELCPNCGANELYYSTAQLRSADEGQTIFYECKKCGYRFSQNS